MTTSRITEFYSIFVLPRRSTMHIDFLTDLILKVSNYQTGKRFFLQYSHERILSIFVQKFLLESCKNLIEVYPQGQCQLGSGGWSFPQIVISQI